tara:strand:- start:2938 stop:3846 length:909 start_codon:yes stop_codon:yes gene_type:complete
MPNQSPNKHLHFQHLPVMANEVLESINNLPAKLLNGGLIIDATIGGGGHSSLILKAHQNLKVIGLDQDESARAAAIERLAHFGSRVEVINANFANYEPKEQAIMVLADLGVSSPQLDTGGRGFSFRLNGPLDMRMNQKTGITAAELLEKVDESKLADIIYTNGEERFSRRIAKKIKTDLLKKGPYEGTIALAEAISSCYPPKLRYRRIHPATRTFQAIRIAVNNELEVLDRFLQQSPSWLRQEGLISIISFHSLEDRKVKQAFLNDERLERLTRKPVQASSKEVSLNPRSRSAKFRIAIRKD